MTARVPRLSYFFPAHNEEANLAGLIEEALETLPGLADTFEIIAVDDGSRDRTPAIADELAAAHPDLVRVVHHPTNLGYGAALRSGLGAARYELVAFTDGDRQFRVADLGRLTERLAGGDQPDVVVGFRIKRADPLVRTIYARLYRLANRIFFGLKITDVDCACKLFRRDALESLRVESGGAFFSAELLIKLRAAGRSVVEVGVPHYPRTAGSPTGAKPSVVFRAVKDFWLLRLRMWANRSLALRRGAADPRPGTAGRLAVGRALGLAGLDVERVDEVAEHVQPRVDDLLAGRLEGDPGRLAVLAEAAVGAEAGLIENVLCREHRHADTDRQGERIGRARIDLDDPTAELQEDPCVVGLLGKLRDHDPLDVRAELLERRREQVVGQRAFGRQALEAHRDRAGLPWPDPDGQVSLALALLEDHHVAVGQHVDAHALDDHLDQSVRHGRIIPRGSPAPGPGR